MLRAFNAAITEGAITANIKHMTVALCLLTQVAPPALWGEAMQHAVCLYNCMPHATIEHKTPYEMRFSSKADLSTL